MTTLLLEHMNVIGYVVLMMIGFYAMTGKTNLVKKLVGMNVLQWSIILFIVSRGAKRGATIPIVQHDAGDAAGHGAVETALRAADYINPLPHVLMLTAIVVAVATTGVALALILRIFRHYGTLEEDELVDRIHSAPR